MNKIKLLLLMVIFGIIAYVVFCLVSFAKLINEKNVCVTFEGIRVEGQPSYPESDNPYMEGVTVKEYTAIIVDDKNN